MEYILYKTKLGNRHCFGKDPMRGKENLREQNSESFVNSE